MARIRCNLCGKELEASKPFRGEYCGCSNETYIRLDKNGQPIIQAKDLSKVIVVESFSPEPQKRVDKVEEPIYTKRVPRKLNYEVR